jgi:hypothetical protein
MEGIESVDFAASSFDYVNQNTVHPVGLAALALAAALILLGPIRAIPLVLIGLAVYVPSAQRLALAGADFAFLRIGVMLALARLAAGSRLLSFRFVAIDLLVIAGTIAKVLLMPAVTGQVGILVQQVGSAFDTLGMYLVVRATIRSIDDIRTLAARSLVLCLPAAIIFGIEKSTGRNMLSVFGGIPFMTDIREGRLRCQGAFAHAILAGCYFVALLPLWLASWRDGARGRWIALGGTALTAVIVVSCASSTPVAAMLFVLAAAIAYPFWMHLRAAWMLALVAALVLHFVMTHGIWHLIARIDLVGGSTGWHRFHLIDKAIAHFDEWWLVGTISTRHWGWGLQDVTNQYILEGVRGGVWAMLALMATIVLAFRACGFWLRRLPAGSHAHLVVFGVGASVFAQMAIFMAVSYFGQTTMIWYLTIAMGAFLAESMAVERARDQARASSAAERAHERRRLQVASEGGSVRAGARTVAATQPRV